MAPLIILVVATLLARLAGRFVPPLRDWAAAVRAGLAVMFFFTAAAHFNHLRPDLIRMVPPSLPNPELLVTVTGILEILGGLGLLLRPTRKTAAILLIVFLLAVLPANIHAARAGVTLGGMPPTPLIPRVLLQCLFIVLICWSGIRASR
jgi:uncharacterized membrane protein